MDGLEGGSVNVSQANESTLKDEGYQSTLDFTTSKDKLAKMEGFNEQKITAMELKLKLHQSCVEKYKNGLMEDNEGYEGKGKGGKSYVQKMCNSEEVLKEQHLSKIKKYLRFQRLDNETQLMISKIDVFRGYGGGNGFFDKLLEFFEGKSMELMEMKEQECAYAKVIYDLMVQLEEKDQEITDSKLKLHQSLAEKYKNGLIDDGDEGYEGKGKRGKSYVQKMYNSEEVLKEQHLSKIKKYLRFQQLDNKTQLMISKIDVFRGYGGGNGFFDELLKLFEGKSMELMEMKEQECEYVKVIYDLMVQLEEKDQVINDSKKKLQAALTGKRREGCLS